MYRLIVSFFFFLSLNLVFAQNNERIFVEGRLNLLNSITLSDFNIYTAESLSLSPDGTFVVISDFSQEILAKIQLDDFKISFFGEDRGSGPGELLSISSTAIDDKNTIYLVDNSKLSISKWDTNLNFINEYSVFGRFVNPNLIALCSGVNLLHIYSMQYTRKGLFHTFDTSFNKINTFYKISDKEQRSGNITYGPIACDAEGNFYYGPSYLDSIKKFSKDGEFVSEIDIIDYKSTEDLIKKEGKWIIRNKDALISSGDINSVEDKIVVSFSGTNKQNYQIIDVYNVEPMEYLYSIEVDFPFRRMQVSKNKLVTISIDKHGEYILNTYSHTLSY